MSVDIYWTDLQPSRLELPAATRVDCMSECRSHWIKESRSIQQHLLCVWPSGGMSRAELNDGTRTATRKTNVTTLCAHRGRSSSFQFVKFFFFFISRTDSIAPIIGLLCRVWIVFEALTQPIIRSLSSLFFVVALKDVREFFSFEKKKKKIKGKTPTENTAAPFKEETYTKWNCISFAGAQFSFQVEKCIHIHCDEVYIFLTRKKSFLLLFHRL